MSVNLSKRQSISLTKQTASLSKINIGLGWDPIKKEAKGFFSKLLSAGNDSIDLDASCLMLDNNMAVTDTIWFQKLTSSCKSVVHNGDNLTGEGDGDDEVISLNLEKIPANVSYLAFTVNSFRGQTFNEVDNAFCRVVDQNNKELARYNLTEQGPHTGVFIASLKRNGSDWEFKAHGLPAKGRSVDQMVGQIVAELSA